jgi:hypothetical protein
MNTGSRIIGLIHASVSGTAMELWSPPEALAKCPMPPLAPARTTGALAAAAVSSSAPAAYNASELFNAMIAPLSRYAIRAVLWDQVCGCSAVFILLIYAGLTVSCG